MYILNEIYIFDGKLIKKKKKNPIAKASSE